MNNISNNKRVENQCKPLGGSLQPHEQMKGGGGATETKRDGVDDDTKVLGWVNSRLGKNGKEKETGLECGRGRKYVRL